MMWLFIIITDRQSGGKNHPVSAGVDREYKCRWKIHPIPFGIQHPCRIGLICSQLHLYTSINQLIKKTGNVLGPQVVDENPAPGNELEQPVLRFIKKYNQLVSSDWPLRVLLALVAAGTAVVMPGAINTLKDLFCLLHFFILDMGISRVMSWL